MERTLTQPTSTSTVSAHAARESAGSCGGTSGGSSAGSSSPSSGTPPQVVRASKPPRAIDQPPWTLDDAIELYQIKGWSQGFFGVNAAGHIIVKPQRTGGPEIDVYEVVCGLRDRGIRTPIILAFSDLLARRLRDLHEAFSVAIAENNYQGKYIAVYPIKVNQQRPVVELVQNYGRDLGFGLEVGSKPELLAVLGMTADSPDRPIICNGFKEELYIEYVTLASKLGRPIIPVIENANELQLILDESRRYGVRPRVGVRVNLNTLGAGRWRHSSGAKAKFGLSITELLDVFNYLKSQEMEDCLVLLHCHMGSQIHDIRNVNSGIHELARIYVELSKLGAGLQYLDIGGGLGVDYDGSQTNFEFSTNYTLAEYASNVIYRVMSVCDDAEVAHPTIISESGRAMVAHHSMLVFNVLDSNRLDRYNIPADLLNGERNGDDTPRPILDLVEAFTKVSERRLLECYHDAVEARDEAMNLFNVGQLALQERALVDRLFWATCARIRDKCRELPSIPEELQDLDTALSDTYFCNLSVFQSLPDIWAINQIFPVVPIHRLNARPTRQATLGDITCDSDGKIDRFVDRRDIKKALELHEVRNGDEYYLAAFLVGAYQETLGDLHNLFGDTHVVYIRLDENGQWWIDQIVEGDTVREVLQYVGYDVPRLSQAMRRECERAVRANHISVAESQALLKAYESGLAGYTYLEARRES